MVLDLRGCISFSISLYFYNLSFSACKIVFVLSFNSCVVSIYYGVSTCKSDNRSPVEILPNANCASSGYVLIIFVATLNTSSTWDKDSWFIEEESSSKNLSRPLINLIKSPLVAFGNSSNLDPRAIQFRALPLPRFHPINASDNRGNLLLNSHWIVKSAAFIAHYGFFAYSSWGKLVIAPKFIACSYALGSNWNGPYPLPPT